MMKIRRYTQLPGIVLSIALLNQSAVAFTNMKDTRDMIPLQSLGSVEKSESVLVTCNTVLSSADKNRFYDMGVDTIVYAGDLSYYFYLPEGLVSKLSQDTKIASIKEIDPETRKGDKNLQSGTLGVYGDDLISVNVLFLKEMTQEEIDMLLSQNGIDAEVEKVTPQLRSAKIKLRGKAYEKLSRLPLVQYMDKVQTLLETEGVSQAPKHNTRNMKTAKQSDVTPLWSAPYDLNGRNISVGVVDGGIALPTHQEFGGRVHDRSSSHEVNFHATHVSGTIAAAGVNAEARGMAKEADIYSYSFYDDAFSEAVLNLYKNDGVLLSNHSYGYSLKERLGEYDTVAAKQDLTVYNNPYINIFEAAGNDGNDKDYAEYGIIKGPGNSKNILTIGALDNVSDDVAELSSTGPVKDGRIKPDLCVRGEYVTSASSESDTSYEKMSGTSMATPAATGMGALVAQAYKRITGGYDIRHDTLKSVLINTAKDVANPGPDYKAGFGLIDAKAAVDTIMTLAGDNPKINLATVRHNGEISYRFTLKESRDFKTTISWVDPEANPSSAVTLVNDIDMVLIDQSSGRKYYPYTLDATHPSRLAVATKANHVDNIEQIEVKNLHAGDYKLVVKGTKIVTDTQEYTVVSNLPLFSSSNVEILKPSKIQNFARKIFMATF
jgi:subtilisin family serine protease